MNHKRHSARRYTGCGNHKCACGSTRGALRGHRNPTRAEIFHEETHREEIEHANGILRECLATTCDDGLCVWCCGQSFRSELKAFLAGELRSPIEASPVRFKLYESARFTSHRLTQREREDFEVGLANIDLSRAA